MVVLGQQAGQYTAGGNSILLGKEAGRYISGSANVMLGFNAGQGNSIQATTATMTNVYSNVGVGSYALLRLGAGMNNTVAVGATAGQYTTGSYNTFVGELQIVTGKHLSLLL